MCVKGTESSISLGLCGRQEFSPQSLPDASLCVDAGATHWVSWIRTSSRKEKTEVGLKPCEFRKRAERVCGVRLNLADGPCGGGGGGGAKK